MYTDLVTTSGAIQYGVSPMVIMYVNVFNCAISYGNLCIVMIMYGHLFKCAIIYGNGCKVMLIFDNLFKICAIVYGNVCKCMVIYVNREQNMISA